MLLRLPRGGGPLLCTMLSRVSTAATIGPMHEPIVKHQALRAVESATRTPILPVSAVAATCQSRSSRRFPGQHVVPKTHPLRPVIRCRLDTLGLLGLCLHLPVGLRQDLFHDSRFP